MQNKSHPKKTILEKKEPHNVQHHMNKAKSEKATCNDNRAATHTNLQKEDIALQQTNNTFTVDTLEMQRQHESFYTAIAQSWHPPIGTSRDCACQITLQIAWDGSIQKLIIDKSSGVLIYDVAARNALYTMPMPSWTHGKTLTVTLRQ
jgi:hypothetical protein